MANLRTLLLSAVNARTRNMLLKSLKNAMKLGNVSLLAKSKHLKASIRSSPPIHLAHTRLNLTVANSPYRVDQHAAPRVPEGDNQPPAPIDPSVDKWFFISVRPTPLQLLIC